ncbi:hypothetical protein [Escherichia coli]|uniref:hypothetical protein n=1 Tax=Escherichia coli TaxID=562 RepID=UPI00112FE602|nr:hypothetical protein [Escherichia coli]
MYKFTPVQIIADYILRFLKNNADAKLYEAMQRLETKIGQFIADGVDELLWSSFFGHADQMVGLCTGGQLGGRAGQRFVLCG